MTSDAPGLIFAVGMVIWGAVIWPGVYRRWAYAHPPLMGFMFVFSWVGLALVLAAAPRLIGEALGLAPPALLLEVMDGLGTIASLIGASTLIFRWPPFSQPGWYRQLIKEWGARGDGSQGRR